MALTQCEKIMRYLKDYGSITAVEAIQEYGIMRLASRISDLRRKGVAIVSEQVKGKNRYGEPTHYSRYRLAKEEDI